jgi:hypothetical protein
MSKIEVDVIDKQSGSALTLGGCGTAVTLASGATQSGFGSTGGISWQTSIKTTDFTAASNEGYFVNTSGGSDITVTLPASPSAGNVVAIKDYARTFGTNKVILNRNGSKMDGGSANTNLETDGQSVTLVFMDTTKGWSLINEDVTTQTGAEFVAATGGNTTATCGDFKIHTFTSPGTFCVSSAGNAAGSNTVSYLVVAGGGGGSGHYGGGGGAGGFREGLGLNDSYTGSPLRAPTGVPVPATAYPITVGAGGTGGVKDNNSAPGVGSSGSSSIFSTITSAGGGGGGVGAAGPNVHSDGLDGGSGGGAGTIPGGSSGCVGAGNTPSVSPPQGNNGGTGNRAAPSHTHGGGGGGATEVGQNAGGDSQGGGDFGRGGNGATSSINNSPTARAGGGGGAVNSTPNTPTGGSGGGGAGGGPGNTSAPTVQGTTNTGGGGGSINGNNPGIAAGGSGGSGIVIIRYKFQ